MNIIFPSPSRKEFPPALSELNGILAIAADGCGIEPLVIV